MTAAKRHMLNILTAWFLSLRSCSLHRLRILQLQLPSFWHWQPLQWICRFVEAQCDVYKSNVASRLVITPALSLWLLSGMAKPDFSLLPSREMQMDWLRVYLQAYKLYTKNSEEVSPQELETLYVQVNKFALVRTNMMVHTHPATRYLHILAVSHISLFWFVSQGFSLLLGFLGAHPGQILLHWLWLPRVSRFVCSERACVCVCLHFIWYYRSDRSNCLWEWSLSARVKLWIMKDWNRKPKSKHVSDFFWKHPYHTHRHLPFTMVHSEKVDLRAQG